MTSSMLTGERRWASARRGGMTIIGKVAVPKPINLPSQRLENHGLNRNVEIVPKGTLSWGNKPSTASNAWGSSTPSPTADGGSASPSHLSGRPSSGGSGTRPSTAGSDRSHEPTNSVWGPKSRPASSSGVLTSNQMSSNALRPNSAETRPGSSQLSRFAESSDNSAAWGPGAAERLDATNSKHDDFSLFSGDFPTLGSEKDNEAKNTHEVTERDTHSRPGSSSSRPGSSSSRVPLIRDRTGSSPSGDVFANSNARGGNVNTWRNDNTPHDGFRPNMEMWQGEPHSYQNANMPPRPFGPWHGNHTPGGPWYRGPPGGPPYGTPGALPYGAPVGPGGFPMEYPYFHGQIPATGLPNSQGVPPPGAVPKHGDIYRPHIPDAFIRPGMPIRPGFYPGPVPYEGYYGPPMGYCNPNERDMPFMPPGPGGYNDYAPGPGQAPPNSNIPQTGPGGHDSSRISEHMEPHPQDPRGQKTVLLKHRNGWNRKDEEQRWENAPSNASNFEKEDQTRATARDSNWRPDYKKEGHLDSRRGVVGEVSPQRINKVNKVDRLVVEGSDIDVCVSAEVLETPNDITLIQQIEGLNAKARTFDGKHGVAHVSGREEQQVKLQAVNDKIVHPVNEGSSGGIIHVRTVTPGIIKPAPENVATGDKGNETAANELLLPRNTVHGQQGRIDHRSKGRFIAHEADGLQKKASNSEISNVHQPERHISAGIKENPASYLEGKDDPSDIQEQRAKMREKAKQRAEQLQKEEEERTREQRAKALAKLEELNRRSQSVEGSTEKMDNLQPCEPTISTSMVEAPNATLTLDAHNTESNSKVEKSDTVSKELPTEAPKKSNQVSEATHNRSSPLNRDVAGVAIEIAPLQSDDSVSKQKQTGHEQKPKTRSEKCPIGRPSSPKYEAPIIINESEMKETPSTELEAVSEVASGRESSTPVITNVIFEPSVDHRKKTNRSGRNKSKQGEKLFVVAVPEIKNTAKSSAESSKQKPSEWELDTNPVEPMTITKDAVQSVESHGRVTNQWKSQNPRRQPRSQQVNRPVDKFNNGEAVVWAPVRVPAKTGTNDEASSKTVLDEESTLTTKNQNPVKNHRKSNRAEMERYVPKPVAKELAQQTNNQQPISPSSYKMSSDGTVGRDISDAQSVGNSQPFEIVVGKIRISTGVMIEDNQQVKAHGLWRQRGTTESTNMQVVQDGSSLLSKPNKDVQEPVDRSQQLMKHDLHSVKELETKFSDGWNMPDEWNLTDNSNSVAPMTSSVAPMTSSVVKDQKFRGREKRHPYKGHIGTGNNSNYDSDHTTIRGGNKDRGYSQSSALEVNETDRAVTLKDNSFVSERSTSQWQPKSQASFSHNERASGSTGSQSVVEEVSVKKESAPRGGGEVRNVGHPDAKRERKASSVKGRPYSPSLKTEEISGGQAPNVAHQDPKREKKVPLLKGPYLQNDGSLDLSESSTNEGLGFRHDQQRPSSGFRKNGNHNNRYGRGNDSRRDWNSAEQDNKQQNPPTNQERQPHDVGSYNRNNSFERPFDGSSSRFRERGQHHQRRGAVNSYGRQSSTVRVDVDYE